jgi:hypothetical protein
MKLEILKKALEHYILSADCSEADRQNVFDAIAECNNQIERYYSRELWMDTVYIVTSDSMHTLLNKVTYDNYGKLKKSCGQVPFEWYAEDVRKAFDMDLTNEVLQLGYHFVSDLWNDNEADGENNPDGTFKHTYC